MDPTHADPRQPNRSTDGFLITRAESALMGAPASESDPTRIQRLRQQFCGLLAGPAVAEAVSARTEALARFAVLALRLTPRIGIDDETDAPEPAEVADLCQATATVCTAHDGIWGLIGGDVLACCIPDAGNADAGRVADAIRRRVVQGHPLARVSVGMASFPESTFTRLDILDNARKALDHAAFFGAGGTAGFDAVSLNISGDKHYEQGDIQGAMTEYRKALELDPVNVNVLNSLGVCYGILGAYEKALDLFHSAHAADPNEVMALYNMGLANLLQGDRDAALGHFLAASEKSPRFEVNFQIGRVYLEKNDPAAARPYLERAVGLNAENAAAQRYYGNCCMQLGMVDPAISAFKRAVKRNPNDAESLSALGQLFDEKGENLEITTIFCQQAVDICPDNGLYRYRLGRLYQKQDQAQEALVHLREAERLGHPATELIELVLDRLDVAGPDS